MPLCLGFKRQTAIARRRQIGKDFSFVPVIQIELEESLNLWKQE